MRKRENAMREISWFFIFDKKKKSKIVITHDVTFQPNISSLLQVKL